MPDPLDIAIFGASLLSAWHNPTAHWFRGLIAALHRRGHRVTYYEPIAFDRQAHRDIDPPEYARSVTYHASLNNVRKVLAQARGADVVVKLGEVGIFDIYLDEEVLEFQQDGSAVVYWDLDPQQTVASLTRDPEDPFVALIPEYDLTLLGEDSEPVRELYTRYHCRRCETMEVHELATDPTHAPAAAGVPPDAPPATDPGAPPDFDALAARLETLLHEIRE